jgi:hypothetical protein
MTSTTTIKRLVLVPDDAPRADVACSSVPVRRYRLARLAAEGARPAEVKPE